MSRLFLEDQDRAAGVAQPHTVDGDHGRIETRTATVSTDIAWLQEQHRWPGLAAIGKVTRTANWRKTSSQTVHLSVSTPLSAERFGEVACAHWGIENRLHWVLDAVMNED